jgi:hypothetical protein
MNVDFEASGNYFCEVSTDNPIFTKASLEEHLHVMGKDRRRQASPIVLFFITINAFFCTLMLFNFTVKQTGPPKIMFKKNLFVVGENLIANCTTTRAKPHPHITWQINGKKVK